MNTKHRAYALTEILVIIVMVVVLMSLSVKPFRMLISEYPRSAGTCRTLSNTLKALAQLKDDVEKAEDIVDIKDDVLILKRDDGFIYYTFSDGQIARRPAIYSSDPEHIWDLANLKTEIRLWGEKERTYAVELTTWNQQHIMGKDQIRFKQTTVFFNKDQQ